CTRPPSISILFPYTTLFRSQLIALIRCQVNEKILSCCGVLAFAYLLAHMLTMRNNPNLGIASSLSEGELSISMAVSTDSQFLNQIGRAHVELQSRENLVCRL